MTVVLASGIIITRTRASDPALRPAGGGPVTPLPPGRGNSHGGQVTITVAVAAAALRQSPSPPESVTMP